VLVDDRGPHVGHHRPPRKRVDHERVQRVRVRHRQVQQEVVATRDHEDADDLGQPTGPVTERLEVLPRRRPDPHCDQRLDVPTERLERHVGVVAAHDAGGAQRPHALR
jgi:hypothetical protein